MNQEKEILVNFGNRIIYRKMKKSISLLTLLFLGMGSLLAQDKIEWLTFEEATAKTQENPKMIFVDVYTDWCGWCKKMDKETFTDAAVIDYINENFYAVKMNAENTNKKFKFKGKDYTEASMAKTMRVSSYPNFVIMDPLMENITQLPGYRLPEPFLTDLNGVVQRFTK